MPTCAYSITRWFIKIPFWPILVILRADNPLNRLEPLVRVKFKPVNILVTPQKVTRRDIVGGSALILTESKSVVFSDCHTG